MAKKSTRPQLADPVPLAGDPLPATENETRPSPTQDPKKPEPESWIEAIISNNRKAAGKLISAEIDNIISRYEIGELEVLFLFDDVDDISNYHSDRLYAAASAIGEGKKDILLIIHSRGGSIEPAYLISKTLKRFAAKKFVVAVPRRAKSAATLICLGADEIHMGMISQLGPIDPQSAGLPVLGVGNALGHQLIRSHPDSG